MAEATTSPQEEKWDIVIKPKDKLFSVDFKELWNYRDLCSLFVKRNIITQYKQTILGPLWFIVQPALTVIMYMVVFGSIAGIPTDGVPRPLFYLAGTCMWNYFAECMTKTSNTFVANSSIFGKFLTNISLSFISSGTERLLNSEFLIRGILPGKKAIVSCTSSILRIGNSG